MTLDLSEQGESSVESERRKLRWQGDVRDLEIKLRRIAREQPRVVLGAENSAGLPGPDNFSAIGNAVRERDGDGKGALVVLLDVLRYGSPMRGQIRRLGDRVLGTERNVRNPGHHLITAR